MKKLVCELCGGNEFIKTEGLWMCGHCKTKYTPEEAQKIMVEGIVKVTIDKSKEFINYKKLAIQNYDNGNYEQAAKYLDKVLEIHPEDWKATYLRGVCSARLSTLDAFRLVDALLAAQDSVSYITSSEESLSVQNSRIEYVAESLNTLSIDFYNWATNHYNEFWKLDSSFDKYKDRLDVILNTFKYSFLLLERTKEDYNIPLQILVADNIVSCCIDICEFRKYRSGYSNGNPVYSNIFLLLDTREIYFEEYEKMIAYIRKSNGNYDPIEIERRKSPSACYIATSIYGSYDCPEVWTLRRFRDHKLSTFFIGRIFISFYYSVSPRIIDTVGDTKIFKRVSKKILDNLVTNLQLRGYDSNQYND